MLSVDAGSVGVPAAGTPGTSMELACTWPDYGVAAASVGAPIGALVAALVAAWVVAGAGAVAVVDVPAWAMETSPSQDSHIEEEHSGMQSSVRRLS
jgi:hypothetical protein